MCTGCDLALHGKFVKALGGRFHKECFKCAQCDVVLGAGAVECAKGNDDHKPYCMPCHAIKYPRRPSAPGPRAPPGMITPPKASFAKRRASHAPRNAPGSAPPPPPGGIAAPAGAPPPPPPPPGMAPMPAPAPPPPPGMSEARRRSSTAVGALPPPPPSLGVKRASLKAIKKKKKEQKKRKSLQPGTPPPPPPPGVADAMKKEKKEKKKRKSLQPGTPPPPPPPGMHSASASPAGGSMYASPKGSLPTTPERTTSRAVVSDTTYDTTKKGKKEKKVKKERLLAVSTSPSSTKKKKKKKKKKKVASKRNSIDDGHDQESEPAFPWDVKEKKKKKKKKTTKTVNPETQEKTVPSGEEASGAGSDAAADAAAPAKKMAAVHDELEQAHFRKLLRAFYARHNPEKLEADGEAGIRQIVSVFAGEGKLDELRSKLEAKYGATLEGDEELNPDDSPRAPPLENRKGRRMRKKASSTRMPSVLRYVFREVDENDDGVRSSSAERVHCALSHRDERRAASPTAR